MILDDILKNKKIEINRLKKNKPLKVLKDQVGRLSKKTPVFFKALKKSKGLSIIAEIKKQSPSKGLLCEDFNPLEIALSYERAGAAALSILTDEKFFGGSAEMLIAVRQLTALPILRKDFTIDPYQIWEARIIGADAVLLIAAILKPKELTEFSKLAFSLGLDVIFEVHTPDDLDKVLPMKPNIIGINNRDLRDFHVDLCITEKLIKKIPKNTLVISESGIQKKSDLAYLKKLGVQAVLIGESLMQAKDPGKALKRLMR